MNKQSFTSVYQMRSGKKACKQYQSIFNQTRLYPKTWQILRHMSVKRISAVPANPGLAMQAGAENFLPGVRTEGGLKEEGRVGVEICFVKWFRDGRLIMGEDDPGGYTPKGL